jgi:mannan endo-1,4-beta-mannosidase
MQAAGSGAEAEVQHFRVGVEAHLPLFAGLSVDARGMIRSMKARFLLLDLALTVALCGTGSASVDTQWPIIQRKGDALYEGGKPFRFIGLAAPNLQQNESQLLPGASNRFPDEYEIRDVLGGLKRVGARATRIFPLSVVSPKDNGLPVYLTGHRQYNEEAFRCLDRVLALGHDYDVRIIVPVIASQSFGGIRGIDEFAALAGKDGTNFWTDEALKADYRHLVDFLVNRLNTVNGILYRDEPAILCWQFGNEFGSYAPDRKLDYNAYAPKITAWQIEMAAYFKKVDPNHLLSDAGGGDVKAFIADPNIDLISTHLYEYWNRLAGAESDLGPIAHRQREETRGKKPLMVDEFGLGSTENLRQLMRVIREEGIAGGLLWSIRGHRRDGGWYYHNEGGTPVNSYHVPGFAAGHTYEETRVLDLLRREACAVRGQPVPAIEKPAPAPVLFHRHGGFVWRGSTGAACYTMERSDSPEGRWIPVAVGLADSIAADAKRVEESPDPNPILLWHDETAPADKAFFYRVKGLNAAGETDYSNVVRVGPR